MPRVALLATLAGAGCFGLATRAGAQGFIPGDLLVSRSVYQGTASTVTVGQTLPNGAQATADGSYTNVFQNETPDPSFGVTSPIFIDQFKLNATSTSVTADGASLNVTNLVAGIGGSAVTSFPSKSELALNLSSDGTAITLMSYAATVNQLDVSNSNTPNHVDPTNLVGGLTYSREVIQIGSAQNAQVTLVNSYSGNNGRAAVLAGGNYYMVGNAGNSGSGTTGTTLSMLSDNTGVQLIPQGSSGDTTVVGVVNGTSGSTTGYQRGFSITQVGLAADKTGKDDNFRGLTLNPFNNTLYVSKGSGGNGVNSIFQVGTAGTPSAAAAGTTPISVLAGFPVNSAKTGKDSTGTTLPIAHPFGMWFANATTLYVADEGDGVAADATTDPNSGLQKWTFDGTKWNQLYTLKNGLNLGTQYSVPNGANGEVFPTSLDPANDGLRNITGKINPDGTVTIYAITSTVSTQTDQGADPNQLVAISDVVANTSTTVASAEQFNTLETARYGEVVRGVSFAPVPEPATAVLVLAGAGLFAGFNRRRKG